MRIGTSTSRSAMLAFGPLAVSLAVLAGGCTAESPPPGQNKPVASTDPPVAKTDPCATVDCSNVIDAVVVPMLADGGLPLVLEDEAVLCRRLSVDLNGIVPLPDEIQEHCVGHSAAEMVDHFMNKPTGVNVPDDSSPYVFVNRRWWADGFKYQASGGGQETWYADVRDLDDAVRALYQGDIHYDEFARRALASPGFARRFGILNLGYHDLPQIASAAFRIFLGREALPNETADFANLWRAWTTQFMDIAEAAQLYPDCPLFCDPSDPSGPGLGCYGDCVHYELGLDGTACQGAQRVLCQSTVLGAGEVVPSTMGFVRWRDLAVADQKALQTPGNLVAAQPQFAEAAADQALSKYLGWWNAGAYRPDFDVPAVRHALAKKLVADGFDIRKMEREIVTSVLYTQLASRSPDVPASRPLWSLGPTKILYAEAWLDSIAQASGRFVGGCDFRYDNRGAAFLQIAGSFQAFSYANLHFNGNIVDNEWYLAMAHELGGCPIGSSHGDASGLVPAITRRAVLSLLCPGAYVPPPEASVKEIIAHQLAGTGVLPTPELDQIILTHLGEKNGGGCDPQNATGCDLQGVSDALCSSLYATALFTYY